MLPPTRAQGEERREKGETLGSDGPKAHLVVPPHSLPLGRPPRWDLGLAATPRGGNLDGGAAPPFPLYIVCLWGASTSVYKGAKGGGGAGQGRRAQEESYSFRE